MKPLKKEDVDQVELYCPACNAAIKQYKGIKKNKLKSAYDYAMKEIDIIRNRCVSGVYGRGLETAQQILQKAFGEAVE